MNSPLFKKLAIFAVLAAAVLLIVLKPWKSSQTNDIENRAVSPPAPKSTVASQTALKPVPATLPPIEKLSTSILWTKATKSILGMDDENWQQHLQLLLGPPRAEGLEMRIGLARLGALGGQRAVESLMQDALSKNSDLDLVKAAFAGWSHSSPDAAKAWLDASKDEAFKSALQPDFAKGLSAEDTDAAIKDYLALSREQKLKLGREITKTLLQTANEEAAENLLSTEESALGKSGIKEQETLQIIFEATAEDRANKTAITPEDNREWFGKKVETGYVGAQHYNAAASELAQKDGPDAAATWLASLSNEKSAPPVTDALISNLQEWAAKDKDSAGEWIAAHKSHPAYARMAAVVK